MKYGIYRFVITAVGVNSQTGIIMTLLGATNKDEKEDKKSKKNKDDIEASRVTEITNGAVIGNGLGNGTEKQKKVSEVEAVAEDDGKATKSVLQTKLSNLALQIGYIGSLVSGATVIILILRYCISNYAIDGKSFSAEDIAYFIQFVIIGVTVLVIAVPEGLPLAITLALTYSVKKMMKDNNLVRHLDACETMGNATSICSDKTGTLTTNRMTCVQQYINSGSIL